jgi:ferredoxin
MGSGYCEKIAPSIFRVADDGQSEIIGEPSPADADNVEAAATQCPAMAIIVEP